MDIKNTVALVTGTNRGVGRAIVQALVAAGASKVYAAARNVDGVKDLVASSGGKVEAIALDITMPKLQQQLRIVAMLNW